MDVIIKKLSKRDFGIARQFAIEGMHLDWYAQSKAEMFIYSRYFWSLEITRATRALGAYLGDRLVGVLLVDMIGEEKVCKSILHRGFVKITSTLINVFYSSASGSYDDANREMLKEFTSNTHVDGELNFFAVDPAIKGKGIGTLLLNEIEMELSGKRIYLYTDTGSTYQFYCKRGFDKVGMRDVKLEIHNKEVPLTCFLFSKVL